MQNVLYIAHFFPPTGGAGVQRSSKFVKFLPSEGILPIVVTGEASEQAWWAPEDRSLMEDVGCEVPVFRAKWNTSESNTLVRRRERRSALIEVAERAIRSHRPEHIFVTMSPFIDAEIASFISRSHGIPWIADLRDPWALDEFQVYRSVAHRRVELRKMRRALASAAGIIMNTPVARERLLDAFPEFRDRPVTSITNGFDPEDFPSSMVRTRGEKFRIVHTGSFHTSMGMHQKSNQMIYRMLGRCEAGMKILPRSPYYLLKALERMSCTHPAIYEALEVVFAGVMSVADKQLIFRSGAADKVQVTGYLGHSDSARHTASADLLFLPLHGLRRGQCASIVPGKTYEYIGSGNPILAALPDGDAKRYVESSGNCRVTDPDNVEGIAEGIRYFFRLWESGAITHARDPDVTNDFDRRTLTAQLATFLKSINTRAVRHQG